VSATAFDAEESSAPHQKGFNSFSRNQRLASKLVMLAKEIKSGSVVNYQGSPVLIQTVAVQTPSARGAATLYKFRGRNLVTRQKQNFGLRGTESIEEADFERRSVKLMYIDSVALHLMDSGDYNQYSISLEEVTGERPYITEQLDGILALLYNGACVGLQLPTTIELEITTTDPAVKGDSATKRTKPATLETGLVVHVPEYLKNGERIKVDSRSGQYISRA
jgi:elongation factor P